MTLLGTKMSVENQRNADFSFFLSAARPPGIVGNMGPTRSWAIGRAVVLAGARRRHSDAAPGEDGRAGHRTKSGWCPDHWRIQPPRRSEWVRRKDFRLPMKEPRSSARPQRLVQVRLGQVLWRQGFIDKETKEFTRGIPNGCRLANIPELIRRLNALDLDTHWAMVARTTHESDRPLTPCRMRYPRRSVFDISHLAGAVIRQLLLVSIASNCDVSASRAFASSPAARTASFATRRASLSSHSRVAFEGVKRLETGISTQFPSHATPSKL